MTAAGFGVDARALGEVQIVCLCFLVVWVETSPNRLQTAADLCDLCSSATLRDCCVCILETYSDAPNVAVPAETLGGQCGTKPHQEKRSEEQFGQLF